ncbi:hypothetical protein ASPBRDRAFT_35289 [Aspergillus brasiliensis CBS 101740]|uniref:Uncharacterized protein n=1 Tax=Aspergillus brasiliensis (strain CBS 101740 / IMI 381727 / IBT 21946) TaxID=767769 RepID=A0A1L9U3K8_ASPBC|nr:hypothetical protein ASPBRDRAFT_35289 [Aspergillus brasiliensis CBS 101740]
MDEAKKAWNVETLQVQRVRTKQILLRYVRISPGKFSSGKHPKISQLPQMGLSVSSWQRGVEKEVQVSDTPIALRALCRDDRKPKLCWAGAGTISRWCIGTKAPWGKDEQTRWVKIADYQELSLASATGSRGSATSSHNSLHWASVGFHPKRSIFYWSWHHDCRPHPIGISSVPASVAIQPYSGARHARHPRTKQGLADVSMV